MGNVCFSLETRIQWRIEELREMLRRNRREYHRALAHLQSLEARTGSCDQEAVAIQREYRLFKRHATYLSEQFEQMQGLVLNLRRMLITITKVEEFNALVETMDDVSARFRELAGTSAKLEVHLSDAEAHEQTENLSEEVDAAQLLDEYRNRMAEKLPVAPSGGFARELVLPQS
jgi:chromosome segregation ATPase